MSSLVIRVRLSRFALAALLIPAACSNSAGGGAYLPPASDSGAAGFGSFSFDAGSTCADASREVGVDAGREAGLDAGGCTASRSSVSFSADVAPILTQGCSGEVCHGSTGWGVWSDISSAHSRECCDGRQLVVPGAPGDSYLIHKLTGHGMCLGQPMPKNRAPLSPAEVQTIYDWICLGAKND